METPAIITTNQTYTGIESYNCQLNFILAFVFEALNVFGQIPQIFNINGSKPVTYSPPLVTGWLKTGHFY
jgi:hypothetical protein